MLDRTVDFRLIVKEHGSTLPASRPKASKYSKQTNTQKAESLFSTKTFVAEAVKIVSLHNAFNHAY